MEINTITTILISSFSALILLLLSIIAFFTKASLKEQKDFNLRNGSEHAEINRKLTIGKEYFKQIDKNVNNINDLDKRVNGHDIKITEINGKIKSYYKKIN